VLAYNLQHMTVVTGEHPPRPVGAENPFISHGLDVFVDQPAESIQPHDPFAGRWIGFGDGSDRWRLTGCAVRPLLVGVPWGVRSRLVTLQAHTRGSAHRGGHGGVADQWRVCSSIRGAPTLRAPRGQGCGVDGAGCRVGPGRGARLSTSPFPRTALQTRRASHPGTGLSTRPATNNGCVAARLRNTRPGLPGRTPVVTGGSCPADAPPQPRCAPSPCARRSRARTTTGTPPRPATNSRRRACPPPEGGEGGDGCLIAVGTALAGGPRTGPSVRY
jgi:hypothetical protein